ncbi:TnsD family Tn7-like transposition protein [Anabaena lutea]|uniref:TniQ family protein n=1 Tax=Anabaena lutea FACHB-196 TaxID=2692881 RepID=A0ABR8FD36_9NOST|nr:TnsD family Tn7-like transposition protein [Anabaena lutea]MBD2566591.1 TniQ family protein [Anabaena lutea FACHB-196]
MIGFFPDPYPDELLYSVCGRYQNYLQYSSQKNLMQDLFASVHARAIIDLPTHIGYLVDSLPTGNNYTVDKIIDGLTLFPFYRPFISHANIQQFREQMKGDGNGLHYRLGLTASTIRPPKYLQFCPICVLEDRKNFGECYWHRLHQIPGVQVCPTHMVFLEKSSVCISGQNNHQTFIDAQQTIIHTQTLQSLDLLNIQHQQLLKISQDADWLLKQNAVVSDIHKIKNRYLYLLAEQELATYGGKVHIAQLLDAFKSYYSPEILKMLQCEVDEQSHGNWLSRLVRLPKGSQHPLRHLLLIQFFGYTVESFFQLPSDFQPFGEGPWLCVNPVCTHFQKPYIQSCQVYYSNNDGTPIGLFSCECGFAYTRKDFQKSVKDKFRVSTVKSYGYLWENTLANLWADTSLSVTAIANKLKVSTETIKHHAVRLGLSFPRLGAKRETNIGSKQFSDSQEEKFNEPNKSELYRKEWLTLLNNNPNSDRVSLRNQCWRVYSWLRKNDSEWLEAHLPPRRRNNGSIYVNWEIKDIQLAEAVRQSAERMKNSPSRPVRITARMIGKDINQLSAIHNKIDKLPLTAKALSEVVETREAYTVRRVWWAAEYFLQENKLPTRSQLEHLAGIRHGNELTDLPKVQEAIEAALDSFPSSL